MEMTHKQRAEFFSEFLKQCSTITDAKGVDYAQGADQPANANFQRASDRLKGRMDKYDVLYIYWQKHCQAVEAWFATRELESEPIAERIKDNINYMLIFASMLAEDGLLDVKPKVSKPKSKARKSRAKKRIADTKTTTGLEELSI